MEDLPLLPGNRFCDVTRTNFLVPRTLSFKNGHRIVRLPRFGIGQTYKEDLHLTEDERQLLTNFQPELIYGKVRVQAPRKFIPARVFYDKKTLRFDGYFKQTIHESPLESYRIRRVIIYYYLEDDTLAIYETPYKNSALNQGMRVRRHRIAKNDLNEPYNWRDLNLGENLHIYSTTYRLCDCDRFTREWLESEGIEVRCPETVPADPYTMKLIEREEAEKQRRHQKDSSDTPVQEAIMEGKVLKFYAVFEHQRQQCEMMRKFIILVYLADETIEIRELHQTNNGYDRLPIYLRRQKVPSDSSYLIESFVNLFIDQREQDRIRYLRPRDLVLGQPVTIFNQTFFLYDCDTFTRAFCHFDSTSVDISSKPTAQPMTALPLVPAASRPNKRDRNRHCDKENRVLRYEAIMESSPNNEHCRRFVIIYQSTGDLISVYEKPGDGFGCSTRKFLECTRISKPESRSDAPVYYGANDLYIGARVEFYKHRFLITNADRSVWQFIEENSQQFSPAVVDSFRNNVHLWNVKVLG